MSWWSKLSHRTMVKQPSPHDTFMAGYEAASKRWQKYIDGLAEALYSSSSRDS